MSRTEIFSSLNWVLYVSKRFNKVDSKGHTAVTSILASLGLGFGVMALIVVISVMNGFQMEFKDAIMEISSYHIRAKVSDADKQNFVSWCAMQKNVRSVTPFYEAQGLLLGPSEKEAASLIRALPEDIMESDTGFKKEVRVTAGKFDLSSEENIILGSDMARSIGAKIGSVVTIFALSGSSEVSLFSSDRTFIVRGIFFSNYSDINATYAFISDKAAIKYFGESAEPVYGIKLNDSNRDSLFISKISKDFPDIQTESWRSYNRTFFGALKVEKNMLMLLVFLIFVVVAVNIYNGMRRLVYERREDIAVMSALGASPKDIRFVFIVKGFLTGLYGALPGLIVGLFLCANMDEVFMLLSKMQYYIQYIFMMIINPSSAGYIQENPMFSIYASIPARMILSEVMGIFFFGVFSSLFASWRASSKTLNLTVSEVLHDE